MDSSSVGGFSATDAHVDIARITIDILLILISQIVCDRRLAAGVATEDAWAVAIMLTPVSVALRIVSHCAAVASNDVSASFIDGQDTRDSKSTNLAQIITIFRAVVEVLIVLEVIGLTLVASWIAIVFRRMAREFHHHVSVRAGNGQILARARGIVQLAVGSANIWYTASLEPFNLLSSNFKVSLKNLHAIVTLHTFATSLRIIWIHSFFTVFTFNREILTLLHSVVFHVSADNAHTAALCALQVLVLALLEMLHGFFMGSSEAAFRHAAFKLEAKQILLNIPMEILESNSLVSKAFLWTRIVVCPPWLDASFAKQRLAVAALL